MYFTHCSCVSSIDFEQLNASWVRLVYNNRKSTLKELAEKDNKLSNIHRNTCFTNGQSLITGAKFSVKVSSIFNNIFKKKQFP